MKKSYKLENLCCANCAAKMERTLNKESKITQATISFMTQKLILETGDDVTEEEILELAQKIIQKIEPDCRIVRK